MTIAELIYEQVKALPDSLAREVLDFIGYLRENRDREEWRDLRDGQASVLTHIWDDADDRDEVATKTQAHCASLDERVPACRDPACGK
jgi:Protein of unknown function (DUF2281)